MKTLYYSLEMLVHMQHERNLRLTLEFGLRNEESGSKKFLSLTIWASNHRASIARSSRKNMNLRHTDNRHLPMVDAVEEHCSVSSVDFQLIFRNHSGIESLVE